MSKLNILQIYDYMELGGAESHIITLSKKLIDMGHNVQIVSSHGPSVAILSRLGIKFYNLDIYNPEHYFENAEKILEIIKMEKIDICHVHPSHSQIVMSLVKLIKNIPMITTIHGRYNTPSTNGLREFFNGFIFISEETREFHLENKLVDSDFIQVIQNCVPFSSIENASLIGNVIKILYVSRLAEDKLPSILLFMESIEKINKVVNVEITIIGQGNKYNEVFNLAVEINRKLEKDIISVINGSVEIIKNMEAADIVVGVGRVLLEALSINKIPICIGNKNYVGIIDREKLLEISKVNFTDRNITRSFSIDYFIEDLLKIKRHPNQVMDELNKTIFMAKEFFNIDIGAKKHEECYFEVIENFKENRLTINNILNYKRKFKDVNLISKATELKFQGQRYNLDNAKENRILLIPNFLQTDDNWAEILVNLLKVIGSQQDVTIVIRIENQFLVNLDKIIVKIQEVLKAYSNKYCIDILIDCEEHDEIMELLFLLEMTYFIPTNNKQKKITYNCRLLGCNIVNSIEEFIGKFK